MSPDDWDPQWVHEHTGQRAMTAWRLVETQYVAATMGLVDSAQEQWLLEEMLEQSKPALPPNAQSHHYLLAAPFRYWPTTATRFRPAHTLAFGTGPTTRFVPAPKLLTGGNASCSTVRAWCASPSPPTTRSTPLASAANRSI